MSVTITKRVGKGRVLPTTDPDVDKVAGLLEQIPVDNGGQGTGFRKSLTHEKLEGGISNFQALHFGQVTGFVDPENVTIRRLNECAQGGRPAADPISWQFKAMRQLIVDRARSLVGKVSNTTMAPNNKERHGWRELWEIHHSAGIPVESEAEHEVRKASPKFRLPEGGKIPFDHFQFVKSPTPGPAWCGIFATWALNQAGFSFKWKLNRGICHLDGTKLPVVPARGITVGDVCIVNDRSGRVAEFSEGFGMSFNSQFLAHHVIVASHPNSQGIVDVVEGNFPHMQFGAHSIVDDSCRMPQGKRKVQEFLHRYELFQPMSL